MCYNRYDKIFRRNEMSIPLALLVMSIQLSDFYLMYIPFHKGMTHAERKNLLLGMLACGMISCVGSILVFEHCGITAYVYKRLLMLGWIPYLVIFMLIVRRSILQHVFIFGMSRVWSIILHNFSAITIVLLFDTEHEILFSHAIIYLLLFAVCLPLEWRYFVDLLPPRRFFVDYGVAVAFLPIIMTLSVTLLWAQEPLIHSWQERFSRFYLPFVFFFLYHHILQTNENLQEEKRTKQNFRLMKEQLTALSEYNRLMQESREQILVMRHDLRHDFRLIYTMLQSGNVEEAIHYIDKAEKLLGSTSIKDYCSQPLINAALSVYFSRAEKLGIKINHKINLPQELSIDERDFALLISNLLENAINASSRQENPARKQISIVVQTLNDQCVLKIENYSDDEVIFDEKNYPRTSEEGHGLGMASIKLFSEKYDAYTDFEQSGGIFKVTMYWQS